MAGEPTITQPQAVSELPVPRLKKCDKPPSVADYPHNKVTKTILGNGITTLYKPVPSSSTVALKVFIKGGQSEEPIPGVSSLLSSTLMKGTLQRTTEQINQELESKGMSLGVSAHEDYLDISGVAVDEDLGELFLILQDVMNQPLILQAEIDKAKERIAQAVLASQDNPSSVAFEHLSQALYPTHPYGNVGKRLAAHLNLITRQHIVDYYHTQFQPRNMLVVAVGNFKPAVLNGYLLGLRPPQAPDADTLTDAEPVAPLSDDKKVTTEKEKQAATWVAKGWLVPPVHGKDYVSLKVLNSLLGSGMSSRMFQNIREQRGLAYTVGSFYPSRAEKSRFVLYIGTDPKNTEAVQQAFNEEIKALMTEPIADQELQEAKDKLSGHFALQHETNSEQAFYLGLFETLGIGYQFDKAYPKLIQTVTAEEIQQAAKTYFSKPSAVSIVKPAE